MFSQKLVTKEHTWKLKVDYGRIYVLYTELTHDEWSDLEVEFAVRVTRSNEAHEITLIE